MRGSPDDVDLSGLVEALARDWQLTVDRLDYVPEGGGAYHWAAATAEGQRCFVTVDDLDSKPWLGSDRRAVFDALLEAYQTTVDLQLTGGLDFVIAAVPARSGDCAVRLDVRHSVAVFPFVEGVSGHWGDGLSSGDRLALIRVLADLHGCTPIARHVRPRRAVVPGRRHLETTLGELDHPWPGGPWSESARLELSSHQASIAGWLASFDELVSDVGRSESELVVTHGEPHPGNLLRTERGLALIDWDTVALDRPERDLWMLDDATGMAWTAYQELTGRRVDPTAAAFYQLSWRLTDLAAFAVQLRQPHRQSADTEKAWLAIKRTLAEDPEPYHAGE